ncbi:hypothetical protein BV25DRAFT_1816121, partial [Artomyces pyxidatus]
MRSRRIPAALISFVERMLIGRRTHLRFDDYTSEAITIENGIGQGDPLSMVLYLYYNADLLDIARGRGELAMAFVDDAILVVIRPSFLATHATLTDMMTRPGGAIEWSHLHNSRFEFSKLALID